METETFRKWLMERGCRFRRHGHLGKGLGAGAVTVTRADRKAELPLVGSKKHLPAETVRAGVTALGLDPAELPGPRGRS